uniref:procollagen-lysine 5-dioxygenase n=1 Tax=Heterorhabditis bacteriophora TaxID=37862 RepID=A0A1I7X073_HETBA
MFICSIASPHYCTRHLHYSLLQSMPFMRNLLLAVFLWLQYLSVYTIPEVIVMTVATEKTDGLKRLLLSAETFNIPVKGGGQKILTLRKELDDFKDDKNTMIIFVDAYDVIFTTDASTILQRFFDYFKDKRIVFGAEPFCWPDESLAAEYPLVEFGKRLVANFYYSFHTNNCWLLTDRKKNIKQIGDYFRPFSTLAVRFSSEYLFIVDGDVVLTNANTLGRLIEFSANYHIGIVAPMVGQPGKAFTNFWGAIASNGYYARSEDYMAIVHGKRIGFWNDFKYEIRFVPFVTSAILINKEKMKQMNVSFSYNKNIDPDMSFCQWARDHGHFMYVDNEAYYGFLVLWEARYVHKEYRKVIEEGVEVEQACPDVYDYPLLSERFCEELIEEMEHFGQWSDGSNKDTRLAGGYENVPTRDIHMNQVFIGYYHRKFGPVEDRSSSGGSRSVSTSRVRKLSRRGSFEITTAYWERRNNRQLLQHEYQRSENAFVDTRSHFPSCVMVWARITTSDEASLMCAATHRGKLRDVSTSSCDRKRRNLRAPNELNHCLLSYPIESNMMFVVRYRPDEQPALRPHHDASTFRWRTNKILIFRINYSIDIALNKKGKDFEGGGVRYIRYNCTVQADQIGYAMMFPGRLTHLHEGLPTTHGTRYILVSFLNP